MLEYLYWCQQEEQVDETWNSSRRRCIPPPDLQLDLWCLGAEVRSKHNNSTMTPTELEVFVPGKTNKIEQIYL